MTPEHRTRSIRGLLVAAVVAALVAGAAPAPAIDPPPPVDVIVQQWDASDPAPKALVGLVGGTVTRDLPSVLGFAARVPETAITDLLGLAGVRAVTEDVGVLPQDDGSAGSHPGFLFDQVVRADVVRAAGHTGAGATVAVVDTGIADVPPLAGRIVAVDGARCVNLSTEPGCQDSYGHGTFVAGLVNAVAPDAGLLSIKLSGRDGSARVSQAIAAIDWVLANKDRFSIGVVNLSLRSASTLSWRIDPLNHAVQRAWAAGITVVVSAGNQGPADGTVAKPADDPWVISVGASNDAGTVDVTDDSVADFSSRGPTAHGQTKPDVVAPGKSLASLRSPGSEADLRYPYFVDDQYRLGSGTSFAAPIVAGAAALLLDANAGLSNDRIKFMLAATARPVAGGPTGSGAGLVDVEAALAAPAGVANGNRFHPVLFPGRLGEPGDWAATAWDGVWTGNLELLLGSDWLGVTDGLYFTGSNWQGSNWQGSNWQGSNWQGSNWQSGYWS